MLVSVWKITHRNKLICTSWSAAAFLTVDLNIHRVFEKIYRDHSIDIFFKAGNCGHLIIFLVNKEEKFHSGEAVAVHVCWFNLWVILHPAIQQEMRWWRSLCRQDDYFMWGNVERFSVWDLLLSPFLFHRLILSLLWFFLLWWRGVTFLTDPSIAGLFGRLLQGRVQTAEVVTELTLITPH